MTVGVDCQLMYLIDNWPGEVTDGPNPSSWTALSATEVFKLGTKRMVYDDTQNGWSILMYLYYTTGAGTVRVATVGEPCAMDASAAATAGQHCHVTNDGSDANLKGPIAVALGTMVTARYAWFWVGGVCPVGIVSALATYLAPSDGSITAMTYMTLADSACVCKYHLAAATDIQNFSAYSMVADTAS